MYKKLLSSEKILFPRKGFSFLAPFKKGVYIIYNQKDEVRNSIGIIFQEPALDLELTAWENLWLHAKLYNLPISFGKSN